MLVILGWLRIREMLLQLLQAFEKCREAYGEFKKAIGEMRSYMRTIGYTDETKIVIFRN